MIRTHFTTALPFQSFTWQLSGGDCCLRKVILHVDTQESFQSLGNLQEPYAHTGRTSFGAPKECVDHLTIQVKKISDPGERKLQAHHRLGGDGIRGREEQASLTEVVGGERNSLVLIFCHDGDGQGHTDHLSAAV